MYWIIIRTFDSPVDIIASFSSVRGDAPRQLVTKSVSARPDVHSCGYSASRSFPQRFQGTDEFFVVVPAGHGALVYLLPHLPGAGSSHLPLVGMELKDPRVPFQPDEVEHFTRPGFLI